MMDFQTVWGASAWDVNTYDGCHPNHAGSDLLHATLYPYFKTVCSDLLS